MYPKPANLSLAAPLDLCPQARFHGKLAAPGRAAQENFAFKRPLVRFEGWPVGRVSPFLVLANDSAKLGGNGGSVCRFPLFCSNEVLLPSNQVVKKTFAPVALILLLAGYAAHRPRSSIG